MTGEVWTYFVKIVRNDVQCKGTVVKWITAVYSVHIPGDHLL